MNRKNVESSMIKSIGFDSGSLILEIEFNSGAVWQYLEFPESLWHAFENTESQGKFFHREIKDQYQELRIR